MSVAQIFAEFESVDFIKPRAFYAHHTFNMEGICLYYYVNGKDSQGYDAALKLDFFNDRIRFTNFRKPHSIEKYKPYFNKFVNSLSCSYDDWEQELASLSATNTEYLNSMTKHWVVSPSQLINTLVIAGELLWDAEHEGWLDFSWWEGGKFTGTLPKSKHP